MPSVASEIPLTPMTDSPGLDRLEAFMLAGMAARGITGGTLQGESLDLDEIAGVNGALPLLIGQVQQMFVILGHPEWIGPFAALGDESDDCSFGMRVVEFSSKDGTSPFTHAPLLLALDAVLDDLQQGSELANTLDLNLLTDLYKPEVFNALTIHDWSSLHELTRRAKPAPSP